MNVPNVGFDALLGLTYLEAGPDRCVAVLDVDERHLQPLGLVHGGVYTAMVEATASVGAASFALDRGMLGAVGIANATDFYRSHRSGRLVAEATPIHRGRTQQVWQVTITAEDDGRLVARGQLRVHNLTDPAAIGGDATAPPAGGTVQPPR